MTNKYPQPGERYQHYKGGQYEVIYRSLSFGGFHARPYTEWFDEIGEADKYGFFPIRFTRM